MAGKIELAVAIEIACDALLEEARRQGWARPRSGIAKGHPAGEERAPIAGSLVTGQVRLAVAIQIHGDTTATDFRGRLRRDERDCRVETGGRGRGHVPLMPAGS